MSRKPPDVASKEKNEYIPSFITKKPFWVPDDDTSGSDYLEHQRLQKETTEQSKWYDRGKKAGLADTKFRKGACENCGAMTHKTKDCLSRPRAKGARWTGKDIQADEMVQDVNLGWDAKRDRWNGYDASEYRNVVEEYEELEALKQKAKRTEAGEKGDEDEGDQTKYEEESDMGRQQSSSTRNLRLREDTAKYLLNLDLDSAKYDPKTRSMVDMGAQADQAAALVAEENFIRASGDAAEFEKAQRYAWETQERGDKNKIHIQANPTSGEYTRKKELEEATSKKVAHRKLLLDKYGGEQHMKRSGLLEAAVAENERYVEYDETGAVKGAPKVEAKSKYPEDVFINNHVSVWGSWWKDFQWGYACCHSTVKNSFCTGSEGKKAFEEAENMRTGVQVPDAATSRDIAEREDPDMTDRGGKKKLRKDHDSVEEEMVSKAKKRSAAEITAGVTDEEMESWKRSRAQANDPMAKYLGNDELVH